MPVTNEQRATVEKVFQAMHARAEGEKLMASLFAENASLTEPFSGEPRTHNGKADIMAWFREAVSQMPEDMAIRVDRLDLDGDRVRADWTCTSSVFLTPMKGSDFYRISGGLIHQAEFVVTEMPPMG